LRSAGLGDWASAGAVFRDKHSNRLLRIMQALCGQVGFDCEFLSSPGQGRCTAFLAAGMPVTSDMGIS
jgi:hypothetical protein